MTSHAESQLLNSIRRAADGHCASQCFHVEGLEVELRAVDPASIRWVLKSMQPLSLTTARDTRAKYSVTYVYSDEIVQEAIENLNDIDLVHIRRHGQVRYVRLSRPSASSVLYTDPDEGVLWVSDLANNSVYLIVSSRTKHPAMAFASLTRELVTRYLAQEGWTLFHAGAVDTPSGALMVVGNGGAGKTSLLMAFLCAGARFVANELLYVRQCDDGPRLLGFPMPIAVGLGTALQFPPLAERIDSPGELEYPRNRLKLSRVVNTPQSEWKDLEDKLQVLPSELSKLLGAPPPAPGGSICGVVVPMVGRKPALQAVEHLSTEAVSKILSNNHIGLTQDSRYRPWMELNFGPGPTQRHGPIIASLSELSPVRFRFGLSLETFEQNRTYIDALRVAHEQESLTAFAQ